MIKRSLAVFGLGIALAIPAHAAPAPNIVLMLADDLGWQDVKCYDIDEPCPMETPHIDALAARGVLFRNGYSPAPTCSPSRCAIMSGKVPPLELYKLVETINGKTARMDIEEAKNLAGEMPEKAAAMNSHLTEILTEMKASLPYWNPDCKFALPNKEKVPSVTEHKVDGHTVTATFRENGTRIVRADVIYATHGGEKTEEWFRASAEIDNGKVKATLPPEATHAYINLIDENNFLVSHPKPVPASDQGNTYANAAIPLGGTANR